MGEEERDVPGALAPKYLVCHCGGDRICICIDGLKGDRGNFGVIRFAS